MKIAIIGAGFTGLAAAHALQKKGHHVTIYEKDQKPGGLAIGYQEKEWEWSLEKHYHHWFTNDEAVLSLAKEINHPVVIRRPHTNWYVGGKIYEFDSIKAALTFAPLPFLDRLRNLATLGLFRFDPFWKPLEKFNASIVLPRLMGKKAYQTLWEPLFVNKFGSYAHDVSLAWFWARIKKRTPSLAYPEGGFLRFAEKLVSVIKDQGGIFHFGTEIQELKSNSDTSVTLTYTDKKKHTQKFDTVIVTLPTFLFAKITPQLPQEYRDSLTTLTSLGATNVVLRLNKPFFSDNTYWLSVADTTSPVMAVVEHTNFMDKEKYHNEHLLYLGNYLPMDDPNFSKDKKELLDLYDSFLKRINKNYRKSLIDYEVFRAPFAQPVIPTNYSKKIPPLTTPLPNIYLANMQQVYPWDRGTNYAVALGQNVAELIMKSQ